MGYSVIRWVSKTMTVVRMARLALVPIALFLIAGCGGGSGDNSAQTSAITAQVSIPLPIGLKVSALPFPSLLKATLSCPTGSTIDMTINADNTASGACADLKAGVNQTFSVTFSYGSGRIELAAVSKQLDVTSSAMPALQVAASDYSYQDIDGDGYSNVYEITHGMDPKAANYTVGLTVSGLAGAGLILQNNSADDLAVKNDGSYTFATEPIDGSAYDVTIAAQPAGQNCIVSKGGGVLAGANITDILVGCTNPGLFFLSATDGISGAEPYVTDGTAAGTKILKDINTYADADPHDLVMMNGVLFFIAHDSAGGYSLWQSDGSAAGTTQVQDSSGMSISSPNYLTVIGGTLYFTATDADGVAKLWKSNGTAVGTVMIKDSSGASLANPRYLVADGTTLYFVTFDSAAGFELWKSDGTNPGTVMVKDLSGAGVSNPYNLTAFNGGVYFSAYNTVNGIYELWKSDGTTGGTVQAKDSGGASISSPASLTVSGSGALLYFTADDSTSGTELWASDGTDAGTAMVKDINISGANGIYYYRHEKPKESSLNVLRNGPLAQRGEYKLRRNEN